MLEQDRGNSNSSDRDIHSGSYSYLFTVFTPTYNRAHSLHRVYESLQAQTFRDFEWLIVDDGCKRSLGMIESRKYVLSNQTSWFRYAPVLFLRDATHYNRFVFHIHNSLVQPFIWKIRKQIGDIDSAFGRILVVVMMPLGWLLFLRDLRRISKSTN